MEENNTLNLDTTSENNAEDILPGYRTVADFTKDGFKTLMDGIKHTNSLPSGRDWNFYAAFESFTEKIKENQSTILGQISSVLKKNEVGGSLRQPSTYRETEILLDANDLILERISFNIDVMRGIKSSEIEPSPVLQTVSAEIPARLNGAWNRNIQTKFTVSKSFNFESTAKERTIRLLTAENVVRPQKFFKDKIDNSNNHPWEPRIKEKPNSIKPLAIFLEETENGKEFSHAYEFELDRFEPIEDLLDKTTCIQPKLLKDTPLIEINNPNQLEQLVEELRNYKIIAIDLEHHSYRTFMGITCLMQISTLDKDYLIDTLSLRNDLWVLNEIFTKSEIVKIFHGADNDIIWLQRDLSLYIVNMFDTHLAAKQLEYSGRSLAYLLQRFCNIKPNKRFQLADWRIRPLPQELKNYAREDTHYLVYIYQKLRNELIEHANGKENLLRAVINGSTELCKKKYFKPLWHENSHLEFYRRCTRNFDNRQMCALKEIFKWRDQLARIEDESYGYVLPNNMLLEIAERLPKEMQGILACCNPVPPLVRSNLLEIHKIVLKALQEPVEMAILKEDTRTRGSTIKNRLNIDSQLHCPHDLTRHEEFRDDLPTLINSQINDIVEITKKELDIEQTASKYSIFNNLSAKEKSTTSGDKLKEFKENFKFLGPFERYKLVKPFIEAKEKKLAEERAKLEAERNAAKNIQEDSSTDNRTDEERINSIKDLFVKLSNISKNAPPPPEENVSLLEMGGSKKRKRSNTILRGTSSNPQTKIPTRKNIQTPVPTLEVTLRSVDSIYQLNNEQTQQNNIDPLQNKKYGEIEQRPNNNSAFLKLSKRERNKERMVKRKEKRAAAQLNNTQEPNNLVGRKKLQLPKRGAKNSTNNRNDKEFNPYNYSMVDFRQFQGGAGTVENKPFKAKFKGRGRPSGVRGGRNNQNNRQQMGAGRGRGK